MRTKAEIKKAKRPIPRKGLSRPHNGGKWSAARKRTFIMSALRNASRRWNPRNQCKAGARIGRSSLYLCSACQKTVRGAANIHADHILPVVPLSGWDSWDGVIERMFCERESFQALCSTCHSILTKEENQQRRS